MGFYQILRSQRNSEKDNVKRLFERKRTSIEGKPGCIIQGFHSSPGFFFSHMSHILWRRYNMKETMTGFGLAENGGKTETLLFFVPLFTSISRFPPKTIPIFMRTM